MQDDSDKQVPLWKVFFGGEKSKTTSTDTKTKTTTETTTTSTTTTTTKATTTTEKPPKPGFGKDESGSGGGSINKVSPLQESPDEGTLNSGNHQGHCDDWATRLIHEVEGSLVLMHLTDPANI